MTWLSLLLGIATAGTAVYVGRRPLSRFVEWFDHRGWLLDHSTQWRGFIQDRNKIEKLKRFDDIGRAIWILVPDTEPFEEARKGLNEQIATMRLLYEELVDRTEAVRDQQRRITNIRGGSEAVKHLQAALDRQSTTQHDLLRKMDGILGHTAEALGRLDGRAIDDALLIIEGAQEALTKEFKHIEADSDPRKALELPQNVVEFKKRSADETSPGNEEKKDDLP